MTITELIKKLSKIKSEYGEGFVVFIDDENNYYRNEISFDLGNYNCEIGWEYLLKLE
jgi:hypothetical protein